MQSIYHIFNHEKKNGQFCLTVQGTAAYQKWLSNLSDDSQIYNRHDRGHTRALNWFSQLILQHALTKRGSCMWGWGLKESIDPG